MTSNFVGLVNQPNQASGQDANQPMVGQSRDLRELRRTLWMIDAYLWIALGINLMCIAAENYFGVLSGLTVLMGATPAMLFAVALIFGGAAIMMRSWGDFVRYMATRVATSTSSPAAAPRPAFAQETARIDPGFTVRTAPREWRSSRIQKIEGGLA